MSTGATARSTSVLGLGAAVVLVTACGSTISSSPGSTPAAVSTPSLSSRVATPTAAASSKAADPPRVVRPARSHTAAAPTHPVKTAAPRPRPATRTARPAVPGGSATPRPTATAPPAPTATAPPAPTATAPPTPAPTGSQRRTAGQVDVVPARKVQTKPPVALGRRAQVSATVALEISSVTAVQAEARLPGEISGPGVAVTVLVVNHSSHAVRVGDTVVTLTDSSKAPGGSVTDDRARPLAGSLAPGRRRRGTYVFTVPKDRRSPVTVTVTLTGESPVVQFVGAVQ